MLNWLRKYFKRIGVFGVEVEFAPLSQSHNLPGGKGIVAGATLPNANKRDESGANLVRPDNSRDLEAELRRDPRVARLLRNGNWRDAAEAAIANLCYGKNCPIESWRTSSTRQQVKAVHQELSSVSE